jgi:hypothetical protein
MADERNREANELWKLLIALCRGFGTATARDVGSPTLGALKARMNRLNAILRVVFDLEEQACVFSNEGTVTARFRAFPDPPER